MNPTTTTRRAAEGERIVKLGEQMFDRIARQPAPDPVLYKTACTLVDLAGLLLATIEPAEQVTP
jgi:hypothetical protein